jgi:hypothetical protein
MEDPDALVVISSHLRPEEAGMLRGLLESAGIDAVLRDDMLSAVNPFLQPAIGGVKLVVRAADVERARDLIGSAGVLTGPGPEEPVDIPEEEWSRPPARETSRLEPPASSLAASLLWPAVIAAVLLAMLVARCGLR